MAYISLSLVIFSREVFSESKELSPPHAPIINKRDIDTINVLFIVKHIIVNSSFCGILKLARIFSNYH